jgi:nucleotide-binding universal stress UspA family protein
MTSYAVPRIGHDGFTHILVVCDGDRDGDEAALKLAVTAIDVAQCDGRAVPHVDVLCVIEPEPGEDFIRTLGGASPERLEATRHKERSASIARSISAAGLPDTTPLKIVSGKGFVEIIRHAMAASADLVIKPAAKVGGLHAQIFGSKDLHLLRKCPCPVWIVRPFPDGDAAQALSGTPVVVAAVDFDRDAEGAGDTPEDILNRSIIETAIAVAKAHGAGLTLVHAWQAPAEGLLQRAAPGVTSSQLEQYVKEVERWHHAALDTLAGTVRQEAGASLPRVSNVLLQGEADEAIAAYVNRQRPITLVMGTIGRTGIPGVIIGNTAEDILIAIDGSVLAVKPPSFESPLHPA